MQPKTKTLLHSLLTALIFLSSIIFLTPVSALEQKPISSASGTTYIISGNAGVGGATLSYDDGGLQTAIADGAGIYSFIVTSGWAGIVTPSKLGYVFTPANRDYSSTVLSDQIDQNYSAAIRKQISVGGYHSCGIQPGGALHCWGDNEHGQLTSPAGTFMQVTSGYDHSCGLKTDSTITCWGYNIVGQTVAPVGTFAQISAGGYMSCALKGDGSLTCWGDDESGVMSNIPTGTFTQISVGALHVCAIKPDSSLICWGSDDYGEVSGTPALPFTQVSAGWNYTCGIKTDGTLMCWGNNEYGQATPPGGTFTQISAGQYHACGIRTDGTVACWGQDYSGDVSGTPPDVFTQIGAGTYHTCALRSDERWICWGVHSAFTLPYLITGRTGAGKAKLSYNDGGPQTTMADSVGDYTLFVSDGWSGTITVTHTGFTFAPPNRSYNNLADDRVLQNFTPTATLISIGAQDGWILESTQGSGVGGSLNATSSSIVLGDNAANRQYRAIVSFNIFQLITTEMKIKSAVLKLYKNGQAGTDPFNVLGKLYLDIHDWGGPFGGSNALQLKDFNIPTTSPKMGGTVTHTGKWYSIPLTATGCFRLANNNGGTVQFRLYFSLPNNSNKAANWDGFVSGNGPAAFRPQLVITYYPAPLP